MFKQDKKSKNEFKEIYENDPPTESTTFSDKTVKGERIIPGSILSSNDTKTIIGEKITVEGSIRGQENLIIEGTMKGDVAMEKHNLTVGSKGRFEGEIRAHDVAISGLLHGKVIALGKVEITSDADFYGEIKANSISIEDGAFFKGEIELTREPSRKVNTLSKEINEAESKRSNVSNIPSVEAGKGK